MSIIGPQCVGLVIFSMGCLLAVIQAMTPCEILNEASAICTGRNLTRVPKGLPTNLTHLDLSGNSVDSTDLENNRRLQALRDLVFLNLSNNNMPTLTPEIFMNLKKLKVLDLSHCKIDLLHPKAFKGLFSLKILMLNNNRIKNLATQFLSDAQELSTLNLANNKLTTVTMQLLEKFERIHEVQLQGNSWICDCNLYPLQKWLMLRFDHAEEIQCVFPPELQGKDLLNLDLSSESCSEKSKRFPRLAYSNTSTSTVTAITNQTSDAPQAEGGKEWYYLIGVLVIAIAFSALIAIGAKFKLFHKYLTSYSHQLLPEQDAISQDHDTFNVNLPRTSELENIRDRTMYPPHGLDEDDGYIEDNYIQTEVKAEDEPEIHVSI
ncbi:leucine-rich repeat-containing protein 19-like [Stegostoma tigrinum]|uniref:leucine-rich repeat-containing protein 19-like n=1 Tax=Stegostoma tigrinum TaxID=3053191 RepID=UPI00202B893A|nr:leucine-rich repeat-containing protein 19-like [Stegostoma tigrinum]